MQNIHVDPITLSELADFANVPQHVINVTVDRYLPTVIQGVETIGFVAESRLGTAEMFLFDLVDVVIQYRQAGVHVFLQIPVSFPMSIKTAVLTSSRLGVGLVLMCPSDQSDDQWDKWENLVLSYTEECIKHSSYGVELIPASSFLTYMCLEAVGNAPENMYSDELIRGFVKDVPVDRMNRLKDRIRELVYTEHGGQESFERLVRSGFKGISDHVSEMRSSLLSKLEDSVSAYSKESLAHAIHRLLSVKVTSLTMDQIKAISDSSAQICLDRQQQSITGIIDVVAEVALSLGVTEQENASIRSLYQH